MHIMRRYIERRLVLLVRAGQKYHYSKVSYKLGAPEVDRPAGEAGKKHDHCKAPCKLGRARWFIEGDRPFVYNSLTDEVSFQIPLPLQQKPWLKKLFRKVGLTYSVDPFKDEDIDEYLPRLIVTPKMILDGDVRVLPPEPWFKSLLRRFAYTYFIDFSRTVSAADSGSHHSPCLREHFHQPCQDASIGLHDSEEDNAKLIRHKIAMCKLLESAQGKIYGLNKSLFHMDGADHTSWFDELVQKVAPIVVNVSITEQVHGEFVTNNNGSGVIVNANGTILTAFDLVANQRWLPFGNQWTPKGQIMVSLQDGRRFVANLVVADKDLGIAVLKITSEDQLTAAVAGKLNYIGEDGPILNVEWPPTKSNSIVGWPRYESCHRIHLVYEGYANTDPTNKESFGGPIINCHGHVLGITQKKSPKYDHSIFATSIEIAMKMVA